MTEDELRLVKYVGEMCGRLKEALPDAHVWTRGVMDGRLTVIHVDLGEVSYIHPVTRVSLLDRVEIPYHIARIVESLERAKETGLR